MNRLVYLGLGLILGLMIMDAVYLTDEVDMRYFKVELAKLILSTLEKPDYCPVCKYEFHYVYTYDDEELQELVDRYLD